MHMMRNLNWILPILGLGILGCSPSPPPTVQSIESPAAPLSGEPRLSVGGDGVLYLSWIEQAEAGHVLRFSSWNGEAWTPSRMIAAGDDWFVNWADFPAITALEDGTLFAHWLQMEGAGTYSYGIRVAISHDGGETWEEPVTPHRDGTESEHGFVSLIPVSPDRMGLFWLDGREMSGGHDDPTGHGQGAMTLRFAAMDAQGNLHDEAMLDPRVCECCSTDGAVSADGSLIAIYRDRSEEEVRDISFVRRTGTSWNEPDQIHADNWKINGCPVNGAALDIREDVAVVAWFTVEGEEQDIGHVRVAFSGDGARSFGDPTKVDDGNPVGRVDTVLLEDGSALVTWIENRSEGIAEIRMRRIEQNGVRGPTIIITETRSARASGFPQMTRLGDDVFFAWTDAGEPTQVRCAVYR